MAYELTGDTRHRDKLILLPTAIGRGVLMEQWPCCI